MKQGNTFITNGPALRLKANGLAMGDTVELQGGGKLEAELEFSSFYAVERAELIVDGEIVERWHWPEGRREGTLRHGLEVQRDGWIAARLWGNSRDSFGHSLFAHSSPVYFRCGPPPSQRRDAAQFFLHSIDDSLKWIDTYGRYNNDRQREEVKELFRRGREAYAGLM
jgi:hypothetical protein